MPPGSKDKAFVPMPGRIFVFGSNEAGIHGAGAAKDALQYGAVWGIGSGLQGSTYAIPTKDANLQTLSINAIAWYVRNFLDFTREHPELMFFVTRIGCGLAGYRDDQIAPLFYAAPPNVELPEGWP